MLNTRSGKLAKVRKVFACVAVGGVKVRSALLIVIPSDVGRQPIVVVLGAPVYVQPENPRVVPLVTSEFPPPVASASVLKKALSSVTVTVPAVPVPRVPTTVAEAFEAKNKPPARIATGAKANCTLFLFNSHLHQNY
jgi:hypothetical protein